MASHYRLLQVQLLNSQAVSSTTTYNSAPLNILNLDNIGMQINIVSGTPTGVLNVQVSIDYAQTATGEVTNAGNWITVSGGSASITAGSPTNVVFDLNNLSATWVRLQYVNASSSGVISALASGKGLI